MIEFDEPNSHHQLHHTCTDMIRVGSLSSQIIESGEVMQ